MVKNIGDGVMIVGTDPVALTDWAIGFQEGFEKRSRPRIGIHYGATIYRDGDYYGRNVNLAARVVARAHAGEVLVTEPVYERAAGSALSFEPIGEVQLKGFTEPTTLYVALTAAEGRRTLPARGSMPNDAAATTRSLVLRLRRERLLVRWLPA